MTVSSIRGMISVDAITANGGEASGELGSSLQENGTGSAPGEDAVFTLTNDGGTIIARE